MTPKIGFEMTSKILGECLPGKTEPCAGKGGADRTILRNRWEVSRSCWNRGGWRCCPPRTTGQPYCNLIAIAATGDFGHLVFATTRATRKYADLMADSRVAVLVDNRQNDVSDFTGPRP